jgi:hypothetical protein
MVTCQEFILSCDAKCHSPSAHSSHVTFHVHIFCGAQLVGYCLLHYKELLVTLIGSFISKSPLSKDLLFVNLVSQTKPRIPVAMCA